MADMPPGEVPDTGDTQRRETMDAISHMSGTAESLSQGGTSCSMGCALIALACASLLALTIGIGIFFFDGFGTGPGDSAVDPGDVADATGIEISSGGGTGADAAGDDGEPSDPERPASTEPDVVNEAGHLVPYGGRWNAVNGQGIASCLGDLPLEENTQPGMLRVLDAGWRSRFAATTTSPGSGSICSPRLRTRPSTSPTCPRSPVSTSSTSPSCSTPRRR